MTEPRIRPGTTVLVTVAYQSEFPDPIRLRKNAPVSIGRKKTVFPHWLWVTAEDGRSGWIPEKFVAREGDHGITLRDYDATELTVDTGAKLTVIEAVAGWLRVRSQKNCIGWIPAENAAPVKGA